MQNQNFEGMEIIDITELKEDTFKKESKLSKNLTIQTTDGSNIFAFIYNHNGKHIPMPLPDFTLVYFDFAHTLNNGRKIYQKQMFDRLTDITNFTEVSSREVYNYYGYSTSCIINLFTSIECFINHLIPDSAIYIEKRTNKTEIYDKKQIQVGIPFMDKLKKVLPQLKGNKNFFQHPTPTNAHIIKLKELRDEIIHTKSDNNGNIASELFKKIIKFDYDQTFDAVSKLMNFYEPDYVEECPCENEN